MNRTRKPILRFSFLVFCLMVGYSAQCLPGQRAHFADLDRVESVNRNQTISQLTCFFGIIPEFHKDPRTGDIWFYSVTLDKKNAGGKCDNLASLNFTYRFQNLTSEDDDSANQPRFIRKVFSDPIAVSSSSDDQSPGVRHIKSKLEVVNENEFIRYPEITIESAIETDDSYVERSNNQSYQVINIRNSAVDSRLTEGTEVVISGRESEVVEDRFYLKNYGTGGDKDMRAEFKYFSNQQIFYSSNGCWLILPGAEPEFAGPSKIIEFHKQHLIVSLSGKGSPDIENGICFPFGYRPFRDAEYARVQKRPNIKSPKFWLSDFHVLNKDNFRTADEDGSRNIFHALIEDQSRYGLDFAAYSPSPDRLDVVYQAGFLSSYDRKFQNDPQRDSLLSYEKRLRGNLEYISFETTVPDEGRIRPIVDIRTDHDHEARLNITGKCNRLTRRDLFEGWAFAPQLSADKTRLFFLAQDDDGDDSSRVNLYVADFEQIQNRKFDCNDYSHISNLTKNLSLKEGENELDYPIRDYAISSDLTKITIFFEIKGQTEVRFFRFDQNANKIVDQFPYHIGGLGKIYDAVSVGNDLDHSEAKAYFVIHSDLNAPTRISRCQFAGSGRVCSSLDGPEVKTFYHKDLGIQAGQIDSDKPVTRESINFEVSNCAGYSIPGFVLRPTSSNSNGNGNGHAIISIHGGPNEAWDGRFSETDYVLAQQGYTVFMPNPSGSTGYGYDYTRAGNKQWGTKIYQDILCVIDDLRSPERQFSHVFLIGFSFGGYIANWIQTEPANLAKDKLDALVSINGLFDLREFGEWTDQFWFPEYHLGCSGTDCNQSKQKCFCQSNKPSDLAVINQNPACYLQCPLDEGNKRPLPILIFSAKYDQRVPYCQTVPSMLKAYRDDNVPFTFSLFDDEHGLNPISRIKQGNMIHQWFTNLIAKEQECKLDGKWSPTLETCVDTSVTPDNSDNTYPAIFHNGLDFDEDGICGPPEPIEDVRSIRFGLQ